MLRLLCFTAHPDDEAGSFGGTLLRYAESGVETCVICLTPGQAATHRGTARSDDELSSARRLEFNAACKLLKVSRGTVLDYPDGKLDRQDFYAVVADLTRRVREFRPHVVMTMGTEGAITAHPDHSMVSLFGTAACHWAGRTNRFTDQLENGLKPHRVQKLYYAPLGGITNSGWKLVYDDKPSEFTRAMEQVRKAVDARFSIGLALDDKGGIQDVIVDSPAWKAGVTPGATLIAVNGRKFDPDILRDGLKAGKGNGPNLELLVMNGDYYKTFTLNYHDGEKYAHLVRDESKPDMLSEIIKPLAK